MLKLEASQASATVLTQELQALSAEREAGPPADTVERETLQARLAENEGTMENLNGKLMALEKARLIVQKDIEDMAHHVDQVGY